MPLYITLFAAGMLTILLPCILPLIPIVLGVSIAGRSRWRPLLTVLGMVVSFVLFTFLLLVVLQQFVEVADFVRIGTYDILLLFGVGFLFRRPLLLYSIAALGGLFFLSKGWPSVVVAAILGVLAMHVGGRVAARIQELGTAIQGKARGEFGQDTPITAFIIGLTMGLVWVPCAGPALGFVLTLVREQPGLRAVIALASYGLGTALPLLLIGYGGQVAVRSVRRLSQYTGLVKQVAGVMLIAAALAFQFHWFTAIQTWLVQHTSYGTLGTDIEERLFDGSQQLDPSTILQQSSSVSSISSVFSTMTFPKLPRIVRSPEFTGLGPWHNVEPITMAELRGKVVLVDFWTYSCINCIRTLPYIQGYWEKFHNKPFVLVGVHTPEFVFEKSEQNVADAIKRHGLTYPVAQDNDFGTWDAFSNHYWPAKYLIDAEGYIRYMHFGEGAYDETDLAIQSLLAEIDPSLVTGHSTSDELTSDEQRPRERTPEVYMGSRSWPALANAVTSDPNDRLHSYKAPSVLELHRYALVGQWQMVDGEYQVLRSDEGEIRMKFLGGEINLVMGMSGSLVTPAVVVEIDGEVTQSFAIDRYDLFALWSGEYGEHEIILRIRGAGAQGYAFTFGS